MPLKAPGPEKHCVPMLSSASSEVKLTERGRSPSAGFELCTYSPPLVVPSPPRRQAALRDVSLQAVQGNQRQAQDQG